MTLILDPFAWVLMTLTGFAMGVGLGLFGPLAGLATTPALLIALPYCGLPEAATPKIAVATAVAILAPLSVAQVEAKIARRWSIGTCLRSWRPAPRRRDARHHRGGQPR